MPHRVTSFAALALADNCQLWNGNREMEKKPLALPLADSYSTLAKSTRNRIAIASKAQKFKRKRLRDHVRPTHGANRVLSSFPSPYLPSVPHPPALPRGKPLSVPFLLSPPSQKRFPAPLRRERRAKPDDTTRSESAADRSGARACSNVTIPTDPLCFPFL